MITEIKCLNMTFCRAVSSENCDNEFKNSSVGKFYWGVELPWRKWRRTSLLKREERLERLPGPECKNKNQILENCRGANPLLQAAWLYEGVSLGTLPPQSAYLIW